MRVNIFDSHNCKPVQDPAFPPLLALNILGRESSKVITTFLESQRLTSRSSGSGMITSATSLTTNICGTDRLLFKL